MAASSDGVLVTEQHRRAQARTSALLVREVLSLGRYNSRSINARPCGEA